MRSGYLKQPDIPHCISKWYSRKGFSCSLTVTIISLPRAAWWESKQTFGGNGERLEGNIDIRILVHFRFWCRDINTAPLLAWWALFYLIYKVWKPSHLCKLWHWPNLSVEVELFSWVILVKIQLQVREAPQAGNFPGNVQMGSLPRNTNSFLC